MYTATVFTHRRDYSGVLANAPTKTFDSKDEAKEWAEAKMSDRMGCYAQIESDSYLAVTGTDDTNWEQLA